MAIYHVARCMILGEGVARDLGGGKAVLRELARTYIHKKGFKHTKGLNPVTRSRFKLPSELKPAGVKLATFKSRSGKAIADPKLLSVNKSGIRVMHASGVASFPWADLPAHVQDAAGYDIVSVLFEQEILKDLEKKKAGK